MNILRVAVNEQGHIVAAQMEDDDCDIQKLTPMQMLRALEIVEGVEFEMFEFPNTRVENGVKAEIVFDKPESMMD